MATTRSLLKHAAAAYASRKAGAAQRIVRWEYHSGEAYDLRPYYFERFTVRRGRPVKPGSRKAFVYGFDDMDRLILRRQPDTTDEPAFEEFFASRDNQIESVAYRPSGEVAYAAIHRYHDGRPTASEVLDAGGNDEFTERYDYDGDRLTRIRTRSRKGKNWSTFYFTLGYDPTGRMRVIRRADEFDELHLPIHFNPELKLTLESVKQSILGRLIELIPRAIADAGVDGPPYAVAIAYGELYGDPPVLIVGLESERQRWLKSDPRSAKQQVWDPNRYAQRRRRTVRLADADLIDDWEIFNDLQYAKGDTWSARQLLCAVAAQLNRQDWRRHWPVTDDFVFVPVDLEMPQYKLKENLKAAVPAARFKLLKMRKLV